jgi:hypothetical protein
MLSLLKLWSKEKLRTLKWWSSDIFFGQAVQSSLKEVSLPGYSMKTELKQRISFQFRKEVCDQHFSQKKKRKKYIM